MQPGEALSMDNYFPRANTVDLINGYAAYASGLGAPVETLAQWAGGSSSKMLAAAGGSISNVTGGTVTSIGTGFGSARWQTTSFGNAGGQYTVFVNGVDKYQYYDGTTLTEAVVTGATTTDFIHAHVFKGRLFFTIKNKLSFAYLGLSNIQGAASLFDLTQFSKRGGYLMAIGTWTRDGGSGLDDFLVAITSEGEVFIYQGSDPSTADDWSLVGIFEIGRPLGRRCMGTYRNDLAILTYDGFIPLSQVLSLDRQNIAAVAISSNINPTFTTSAQQYGTIFGWEFCFYAKQNMGILNIPVIAGSQTQQYVVNTDTGAWCRFLNQNGLTWLVFNNNLYFGDASGNVFQADSGDSFNGSPIVGSFQCAYDYFGDSSSNKQYQMIRPILLTSGNLNYQYGVDVDFNAKPYYGTGTTPTTGAVTPWGSPWGSPWSSATNLTMRWLSGARIGRCASFKFQTSTSNQRVSVQSIDWAWQRMGLL